MTGVQAGSRFRKGAGMDNPELVEVSGTVVKITYRNENNQYTIFRMAGGEEAAAVVGVFPMLGEGETLRVWGRWEENITYGRQLRAQRFTRTPPESEQAMLRYLSSGVVKGIGPATALRMVEAFGTECLQVLEQEPSRLAQLEGVSQDRAMELSRSYRQIQGLRELMTWLSLSGIAPEFAALAWKQYGPNAQEVLRQDPYCLCEEEIGAPFQAADGLARSLTTPQSQESRVQAGTLYVLRHNLMNGHTCLPQRQLAQVAAGLLQVTEEQVLDAIDSLTEGFRLQQEAIGGQRFLFLPNQHEYETYTAARMKAMLRTPPKPIAGANGKIGEIEQREGIQYAGKQRAAIRAAMEQGVLILTGGPGTGKTTTLNAIIRILKEAGEQVLLAAPTGRAAKRMSELTGEEAKTIHRMLQVQWDELDRPYFKKNEQDPLQCECLVVDELSMVDSYLFDSLLRALPLGCRLILVGDTDQLPSVGPGNVLGDLISSELFPTVQLDQVFRQSMESLIVASAHQIVRGQLPELGRKDNDFFFLRRRQMQETQELVVSLVTERLPKAYGYSPMDDIQVLCPSRKGELGTVELNRLLREVINPPAEDKEEVKLDGRVFRTWDKVMQVRNDYNLEWERDGGGSGKDVFNGDMGVIQRIDSAAKCMEVRMDDKVVTYPYEKAAQELELCYAITVHKSQGSEFPAVVIPLLSVPKLLRYRNLLYTAVTRAKKLLILAGDPWTLQEMVENNRKTRRYTALRHFLEKPERGIL